MNKMGGVVFMMIGLAVIAVAYFDVMGSGGSTGDMLVGGWPPLRTGVLSVGAVVAIFGCYSLVKKPAKKK
ncbi:MAG: hypothetical protein KF754_03265 [Planctomycetes bacterium]|nr:hypothetical protein [Planctomycetota bacterium]